MTDHTIVLHDHDKSPADLVSREKLLKAISKLTRIDWPVPCVDGCLCHIGAYLNRFGVIDLIERFGK